MRVHAILCNVRFTKQMRLHGSVEHVGTSASAGHDVTYVREPTGCCRYDEAHVSRSPFLPISVTRSAYLLLYKECPMAAHAPQQQSNFYTAEQSDIIIAKAEILQRSQPGSFML